MPWFRKSRGKDHADRLEPWQAARLGDQRAYRRRLLVSYVLVGLIHSGVFIMTSRGASGMSFAGKSPPQQALEQTDAPTEIPPELARRPPRAHALKVSFHAPPAPEDGSADGSAGLDEESLKSMVEAQQQRIEQMSAEEQDRELAARVEQLNQMNPDDVNAAVGMVESMMGVPDNVDHALKPDPNATGPFDHSSMVLHDVLKKRDDQGQVVYEHVWIDKAGRTLRQARSGDQMDAQEKQMAGIYDMARDNPIMQPLLDIVKKMDAGNQKQ